MSTSLQALPPLPDTEWVLHMPPRPYEPEWTSSQDGYDAEQMHAYAAECVAAATAECSEHWSAKVVALEADAAKLLDMAMMLRTCAWALRRGSSPDLGERALELLKKHDLLGSTLRRQ